MSFPKYDRYKDSGVEWLGEVPQHWKVLRLGFLCKKIGSGKTPLGGAEVYTDDGILFLRSQNIYDEGFFLDDVVYISDEIDKTMPWSRVLPNDILLNITGASLGRTCLVPDKFVPANVNQHVCIIRLEDQRLCKYVALVLKSSSLKAQIDITQTGANREGLNFDQISKLSLTIPPLPEQRSIATFLDRETTKIDELIAEQQQLIDLLKEKRQAVISHAVTKGLNPDAPMKDSAIEWLGEVPEHWDITRIKWYFDTASGGTPDTSKQDLYYAEEEGIPWIRTTDLGNDVLSSFEVSITEKALCDTACAVLPVETVMVAMYGGDGTIGKNGILAIPATINQAVCGLLPNSSFVSTFTFRYIQFYRPHWMIGAESSRKDPNISQALIRNAPILRPPLEEQNQIVTFIERETTKLDELIAETHHAIALLQERRTALISAAVTGKIDVRSLV